MFTTDVTEGRGRAQAFERFGRVGREEEGRDGFAVKFLVWGATVTEGLAVRVSLDQLRTSCARQRFDPGAYFPDEYCLLTFQSGTHTCLPLVGIGPTWGHSMACDHTTMPLRNANPPPTALRGRTLSSPSTCPSGAVAVRKVDATNTPPGASTREISARAA